MCSSDLLHFTATTKLTFNPESKEQAGITGYYDTKTYARLGLQLAQNGKLQLVLEEQRYGKKTALNMIDNIKCSSVYLRMKVDKLRREFFYSYDNKTWLEAGVIADAAFLSDQGTPNWGFMGMMTGVYSFNRGTLKQIPADFDFFNIETTE